MKKNNIILVIVVIAVVVVAAIFTTKKNELKFKISANEILHEVLQRNNYETPEKLKLLIEDSTHYRFIDLRNPYQFQKDHIPGAVNIPFHSIYAENYKKIFEDKSKVNVLYASNHTDACGPWMLLRQMGYENLKLLLGGFEYAKQNVLDTMITSVNYFDEKAMYDFAKEISQTAGSNVKTAETATTQASKPAVVKKKKSAGGGC